VYTTTGIQVTGNTINIADSAGDIGTDLIDAANLLNPAIFTDPTNVWKNNLYLLPSLPWLTKSWDWGENNATGNAISWATWLLHHPTDSVQLAGALSPAVTSTVETATCGYPQ
jgi:hypothetical protein